jgi:hypothetical protein
MHTGGVVLGTGTGMPGGAKGAVVLDAGAAASTKFGGPKARVHGQARAERGLSVVATRAPLQVDQGRQVPKHRMPKAPPVSADDVGLSRQERGDMFAAAFERKFAAAALVAAVASSSATGS